MAATSKHYGDVVNWIEKVIDSCNNLEQETSARNLVKFFSKKYLEIDKQMEFELSRKLYRRLDDKFFERIETKLKYNQ